MKPKRKKILKGIVVAALSVMLAFTGAIPAMAETPYLNHVYDHWAGYVPAPAAYVPTMTYGGRDLVHPVNGSNTCPRTGIVIGNFNDPQEITVDRNGLIYIADTRNHRIIVHTRNLQIVNVITGFWHHGEWDTFDQPNGIFVDNDLSVYIADTENHRVVRLCPEGELLAIVRDPDFNMDVHFDFVPMKVCVDRGGRVYAIARGVFEGIVSFDPQGNFTGFFGTIAVRYNPLDMLWRNFMTQEQIRRSALFIPTEFASMAIDEYGFIFTTNIDLRGNENKVKRLNPKGQDVLLNFNTNTFISGDQWFRSFGRLSGPSLFVDVVARGNGMYSALDATRNRLFTYDSEGNLLYVLGGTGSVVGMSRKPTSVTVHEETIMILDAVRNQIVCYEPTEYGRLINQAIALRYRGDEAAAVEIWERVLEIDENYILAYSGIGKALMARGDNELAMEFLRKAMDVENYSIAFKRHRNEVMKASMNYILTGGMVLLAAYVGLKIYKRTKKKGAKPA
jgi:hypothetical protein